MKKVLATALLVALPATAFAETQLERLESISERLNDAMFSAMIRMVAKEGGNPEPLRAAMPDGTWDDAYRDAGACILDRYTDASSASAVDTMLDEMEAFIPRLDEIDLAAMGEGPSFLPEGVSEDYSMTVNSECGLTDIMMERMSESGFMATMMQSMSGK
ncbi:hypothetical protein [Marivita sp. XM-24bin2]|jgi:hypothetical protein|uniref:hypothetical protein n=1 Tax=unclassified Marivita TaxID=2632480 RepID=UPI000D79679F|nr:hypothetical protein [Marivita sp. XM-24bin2]MCR9108270.1 hypothetical protein [Paracoccaceae bacterium]PWL37176.1 MAG: hypothetical protein DCO97_01270 [Marivita sp. XM-24bin2]